jgi:hypothetical protein
MEWVTMKKTPAQMMPMIMTMAMPPVCPPVSVAHPLRVPRCPRVQGSAWVLFGV